MSVWSDWAADIMDNPKDKRSFSFSTALTEHQLDYVNIRGTTVVRGSSCHPPGWRQQWRPCNYLQQINKWTKSVINLTTKQLTNMHDHSLHSTSFWNLLLFWVRLWSHVLLVYHTCQSIIRYLCFTSNTYFLGFKGKETEIEKKSRCAVLFLFCLFDQSIGQTQSKKKNSSRHL